MVESENKQNALYTYIVIEQISFIKTDEYKIQVMFGLLAEKEQEVLSFR